MKIDFVSDVSCPWCVIGLKSLLQAIERLGPDLQVQLHFQPFELNPRMPAGGQDLDEHLHEKYGSTPAQTAGVREAIRQRGAELGFRFDLQARSRIYNTFDCHRLLHWAGQQSAKAQLALKLALFEAYFTAGRNPGDKALMLELVANCGLDAEAARAVLDTDAFADEVRQREAFYHQHNIHSVPSVIINDRHLVQGGQEPHVYEQVLRQLSQEA